MPVKPHPAADLLDIRPDPFAECGNFIDKGDLGRQKRIRGVFDHLGTFQIGRNDRKIPQVKRPVDLGHHLGGAVCLDADDHPVGLHEIVDCRPFTQEFRVRSDVKLQSRIGRNHHLFDLAVGADRDRRFRDHDDIFLGQARDLFGGGHHIGQIRMAIATPRGRAHRNKHRIGAIDRRTDIHGKGQTPGLDVTVHDHIKARLVNRDFSLLEHCDLGRVPVDTDHLMTEIRKANPRDKPDITGADHCNTHVLSNSDCCLGIMPSCFRQGNVICKGKARRAAPMRGPPYPFAPCPLA